jgi:UDP-N-acetyl-D-mannosaminuronic acid transferase (WecB/TagA/CpsF family)
MRWSRTSTHSVESANKTIVQLNGAIADANKVISDPAIPSTIGHADKILADGEKVADRIGRACGHREESPVVRVEFFPALLWCEMRWTA